MRRAMADAEVGDDVYREDPTVNRLEEMSAERCGKDAALFVASGTMGNLIALLTHCGRGHEVILGATSHMYVQEQGGMSAIGGIYPHPLDDLPSGQIPIDQIDACFLPDDDHLARISLISLEDTHNVAGGRVLPLSYLEQVQRLARRRGVALHLDGARLFNAAVALGVPVSALAACADSLSFCLSKGLACPVGSVVVGDADFVREARRNRKLLGGGMRQAGIIAAAGIVALNEMIERLAEDHANARALAEGLSDIPGLDVDPDTVETNIVFARVDRPDVDPARLVSALQALGVKISAGGFPRIRLVTHYGIGRAEIARAVSAFSQVLGSPAGR